MSLYIYRPPERQVHSSRYTVGVLLSSRVVVHGRVHVVTLYLGLYISPVVVYSV